MTDRVVMWRSLQIHGIERCELRQTAEVFSLAGTILGVFPKGQRPAEVRYRVDCDEYWRTRRVLIEQIAGTEIRTLSLSTDDDLQGCVDVDLGLTPATNTIPIRRLRLNVGETQDVTAAWVRFPELTVQPLRQTYARVSHMVYRYQSATGFSAEISVDDLGLVVNYPGGWERIAVGDT
jgi:hypothetical protein